MIKNTEENKLFDVSTLYLEQLDKAIYEADENARKLRLTRAGVMREVLGQDPQKRQIPVEDRPKPVEDRPQPVENSFLHKNQIDTLERELVEQLDESLKVSVSPPQLVKKK